MYTRCSYPICIHDTPHTHVYSVHTQHTSHYKARAVAEKGTLEGYFGKAPSGVYIHVCIPLSHLMCLSINDSLSYMFFWLTLIHTRKYQCIHVQHMITLTEGNWCGDYREQPHWLECHMMECGYILPAKLWCKIPAVWIDREEGMAQVHTLYIQSC